MCSVNGGLHIIIISKIIFDKKIKCVFLLNINVSQQIIVNFYFTINVLSLSRPFLFKELTSLSFAFWHGIQCLKK